MNRRLFFTKLAIGTTALAFAPTAIIPAQTEVYKTTTLWPLMEELIEQQLHYNRVMSQIDYIIAVSAKEKPEVQQPPANTI